MPITAYTGLPRHGKTYQVVTEVIVPALRQGRRVVTNIAGVNEEKIRAYLVGQGVDESEIGEVVHVTHEEVLSPLFFRTDKDDERERQEAVLDPDNVRRTFVRPGDLVALDEVWRFWKKRGEIDPRHMNFFRMHGHLSDPKTGLICEVALISQSVRDFNENIREVIDETYRVQKDIAVGSDKTYLVVVYSRGSETARDEIRRFKGYYKKEFFAFYKSHSQAQAGTIPKEDKIDKRGNILRSPLFKYAIPGVLALGFLAVPKLYGFFHPEPKVSQAKTTAPDGQPQPKPETNKANDWRVVGYVRNDSGLAFVLADGDGFIRYETRPYDSKVGVLNVDIEIDKQKYSNYSGPKGVKSASIVPGS